MELTEYTKNSEKIIDDLKDEINKLIESIR